MDTGKRSYHFMDVLRLLSMVAIVFYHMVIQLGITGIRQIEATRVFYANKNMHIATVGVGLFFLLSGAGLMLAYGKDAKFSAVSFFKRRFFKILIPFYLVYAYRILLGVLCTGKKLAVFFPPERTPWRFIFTILGVDTYLSNFGVETYSLGIGEWFLGCLLLMYLLFPLLRWCMIRKPHLMGIAAVIYLLVTVFTYSMTPYADVAPFINFTVKIFDFVAGMYLGMIRFRIPKWMLPLCLAVQAFYIFYPAYLSTPECLNIALQFLSAFVLFRFLEPVFEKLPHFMKAVRFLCGFTYPYFLVHHLVIDLLTSRLVGLPTTNADLALLFLSEILVTSLLVLPLRAMHERILKKVRS